MDFAPETRMQSQPAVHSDVTPRTLVELQEWIRDTLHLQRGAESALLAAIDGVFTRHERLWQESKQEAIQALAHGFTEQIERVKGELHARDAAVSSISR